MDLQDGRLLLLLMSLFEINMYYSVKADYILNMTHTANVTLSSQHKPADPDFMEVYNATNAIDGYYNTDMIHCLCCTHSKDDDSTPSLEIDLIGQYPIRRIVIYGRTDWTYDPRAKLNTDVTVELDGTSVITEFNNSTYQLTVNDHNITFARKILISRQQIFLIICEVQVTILECSDGQFFAGSKCETCHCKYEYCNRSSGICPTGGCQPGWMGDQCNIVCSDGSFGFECRNKCSEHCLDNSACNKTNGHCVGGCKAGYDGEFCNITCTSGTYGFNCNETCGNCKNNQVCDRENGTCENGCVVGYMEPNCQQNCTGNTFGDNCIHQCHCEGDIQCDIATGECPNGHCSLEYGGKNCSKDLSLLPPIKNQVNTSMSVPWSNWTADKAIDGITGGNGSADECQCCSATITLDAWWMLDLGQMYPIKWVKFYGRSEVNKVHQFKGFQLYLSNSSSTTEEPFYRQNVSEPGYVFAIPAHDTLAQYLTIRKNNSLVVCELIILEGVCRSGTFGNACATECHCIDDNPCHRISGECQSPGCKAGWRGVACNEACLNGTYGLNCFQECTACINKACDPVNGSCSLGMIESDTKTDTDDGSLTGIVAGIVVACVVCVILAGIAVVVRRKGLFPSKTLKSAQNEVISLDEQPVERPVERTPALINQAENADNVVNEYYSFLPRNEDIKVHQLWNYIQQNMKNGCDSFYSQFKSLKRGLVHKHDVALKPENTSKNRYTDMVAYDHSRVPLISTSPAESDYINACFIDGFEKINKFIASQGPTKNTVNDFWRMVWQQRSDEIVMLTNLIELGKRKCLLYWPEDGETQFGKIVVTLVKVDTSLDYVVRHLEIRQHDEAPRTVTQYHFTAWPDKDVPDSAWCLVNFWRVVTKKSSKSDGGPIVVHCSAGIGRTGTFIALDNLYNQAVAEGCLRPLQMVETLRRQRVNMVQTQKQYVYLHEAVAEALLFGTHFVWSSQYENMYTYMIATTQDSSLSRLELQYNLINKSLMDLQTHQGVEAAETEYNNVNSEYINVAIENTDDTSEYTNVTSLKSEIEAYGPHMKTTRSENSKQLDELFLPNYRKENGFLLANSPDEETVEQVWTLIKKYNVKTIIMLTEKSSKQYKTSCCLGVGTNFVHKTLDVVTSDENIDQCFTEREFKLTSKNTNHDTVPSVAKQFYYTAWDEGHNIPGERQSMLEFLEAIHKWQADITESQPVLIHSGIGVQRSGIICVLMSVLQRIRQDEGRINIVESVMTMKQRNMDIIPNFEQYRYCHDVILTHIREPETQNTDIYQNI